MQFTAPHYCNNNGHTKLVESLQNQHSDCNNYGTYYKQNLQSNITYQKSTNQVKQFTILIMDEES